MARRETHKTAAIDDGLTVRATTHRPGEPVAPSKLDRITCRADGHFKACRMRARPRPPPLLFEWIERAPGGLSRRLSASCRGTSNPSTFIGGMEAVPQQRHAHPLPADPHVAPRRRQGRAD